jgi:hypothetical protein
MMMQGERAAEQPESLSTRTATAAGPPRRAPLRPEARVRSGDAVPNRRRFAQLKRSGR